MSEKLRSVNTKFWDDPWIQDLPSNDKLLFLYLLTNPLTNLLGVYEITVKRICFDTGLTDKSVLNGLERFGKDKKAFFLPNNYIILPNWLKNQRLNTNMKVAVSREFNALPKEIKDNILSNHSEGLDNGSEGLRIIMECLGKYEIEIEREIEDENCVNIPFDDFWNLYNKKLGDKEKCRNKWNSLTDDIRKRIIETLPDFLSTISDKQYQPYPHTYLTQKRWEDNLSDRTGVDINGTTSRDFYDNELELSGHDPDYEKIIKILFGENNLKLPLDIILKMPYQLTYDQFNKLNSLKKQYRNFGFTPLFEEIHNSGYSKNKTTVFTTFIELLRKRHPEINEIK